MELNQPEAAFLMGVATGYMMAAVVVYYVLVVRKDKGDTP